MAYALIVMVWYNGVALTSIPMRNAEICDAARREVLIAHDARRAGTIAALCVRANH